jgi:CheY-like chemotaxis protein
MSARVAVVDDDESLRELIASILLQRGYEVRTFEGAADARDGIPDFAPHLIVCDVDLGDGCGLDLVTRLRDQHGVAVPAILLSSLRSESDMIRGFAAGAVDYMAKPFAKDELLARCAVHLSRTGPAVRGRPGAVALPERDGLAFGRYRVVRELGAGGFGQVLLAKDEQRGGAPVALKVLSALLGEQVEPRLRFIRETYAASRLQDARVAGVLDVGAQEGRLYYAMEWVDGPSLLRRVEQGGPLAEPDALRVLRGLLQALAGLERAGVIHRDIKPDNIVLRGGKLGDPVLVDFGLAKLPFDRGVTNPDFIMGTPAYLPPEVIHGRDADARSDLYQAGLVLRHALCGEEAFPDLRGLGLLNAIASGPIPPPPVSTSPPVAALLDALLATAPADRPQTAAEALAMLPAG